MIDSLPLKQQDMVARAANRVNSQNRESFKKYVEDMLRARRDPPINADVRHACCASLLKYGGI
jgi:hypothetical protein